MTFQNLISPKSRQKYIKKQSQPLIIKQLRLNFVIPLGLPHLKCRHFDEILFLRYFQI